MSLGQLVFAGACVVTTLSLVLWARAFRKRASRTIRAPPVPSGSFADFLATHGGCTGWPLDGGAALQWLVACCAVAEGASTMKGPAAAIVLDDPLQRMTAFGALPGRPHAWCAAAASGRPV
jgi:hypothetical protein